MKYKQKGGNKVVSDLNNISRETIEEKRNKAKVSAKIIAKIIREQKDTSFAPFKLSYLFLIKCIFQTTSANSIVKSAPKQTYAHIRFVFFRDFWYNINNHELQNY